MIKFFLKMISLIFMLTVNNSATAQELTVGYKVTKEIFNNIHVKKAVLVAFIGTIVLFVCAIEACIDSNKLDNSEGNLFWGKFFKYLSTIFASFNMPMYKPLYMPLYRPVTVPIVPYRPPIYVSYQTPLFIPSLPAPIMIYH